MNSNTHAVSLAQIPAAQAQSSGQQMNKYQSEIMPAVEVKTPADTVVTPMNAKTDKQDIV